MYLSWSVVKFLMKRWKDSRVSAGVECVPRPKNYAMLFCKILFMKSGSVNAFFFSVC